jgi:hypothetical protein
MFSLLIALKYVCAKYSRFTVHKKTPSLVQYMYILPLPVRQKERSNWLFSKILLFESMPLHEIKTINSLFYKYLFIVDILSSQK